MKNSATTRLRVARNEATSIQTACARMNLPINRGQALELAAAVHGHATWHVYRNVLLTPSAPVDESSPQQESVSLPRGPKFYAVSIFSYGDFVAKKTVLANSLEDAKTEVENEFFDVENPSIYARPIDAPLDVNEIEKWLLSLEFDASDLDDMVHENAHAVSNSILNTCGTADKQMSHIERVDHYASSINNGGLTAQLSFLKDCYLSEMELASQLHTQFGLNCWPAFNDF